MLTLTFVTLYFYLNHSHLCHSACHRICLTPYKTGALVSCLKVVPSSSKVLTCTCEFQNLHLRQIICFMHLAHVRTCE